MFFTNILPSIIGEKIDSTLRNQQTENFCYNSLFSIKVSKTYWDSDYTLNKIDAFNKLAVDMQTHETLETRNIYLSAAFFCA